MRYLFSITGVVLFLAAFLCAIIFPGNPRIEWSIFSVGFALSGSLCYLSLALTKPPHHGPKEL